MSRLPLSNDTPLSSGMVIAASSRVVRSDCALGRQQDRQGDIGEEVLVHGFLHSTGILRLDGVSIAPRGEYVK